MAQNKTQPNNRSVEAFLSSVVDEKKQRDARIVDQMLREITGQMPVMWGESIVGYGSYHYKYPSGREGDYLRIGFSPRKQFLTIYIMPGYSNYDSILSSLGKFKTGKSCLYLKKLDDVDLTVLATLMKKGWEDMLRLCPIN